jgi:hypothetical protein
LYGADEPYGTDETVSEPDWLDMAAFEKSSDKALIEEEFPGEF